MDTIGGDCQVSGFHSLPIRCFLEVWEPEMETDCVRMRQSYGALYPHNLHSAMQCGSASACMNAVPGVISTRGSEGREGEGEGERRRAGWVYDFGTHVEGSHDGKTSQSKELCRDFRISSLVIGK